MSNETVDTLPEEADLPDKLYFRIGEVAQLVGVDSHVLRYGKADQMKPTAQVPPTLYRSKTWRVLRTSSR